MQPYSLKPTLLITGGHGQLAMALARHTRAQAFQLLTPSHHELDITDVTAVKEYVHLHQPTLVINTAAYTLVDKAEHERAIALRVNQDGAKNLAMTCEKFKIPLLHVSTDYVFDGSNTTPYRESDFTNPINFYGESKLLGEQAVQAHCEQHIILRVSAVFSEFGNNFLKTILRLAREKTALRIVADQTTCPTYAGHIAGVLYTLTETKHKWGLYHYCDRDAVSWHEFATAIVSGAQQEVEIHPISSADYPTAAKRPAYSVLNCSKLLQEYGIQQSTWNDGIQATLNALSMLSRTTL